MIEGLSRTAARNVFLGGSVIFFLIFVGLTAHSHYYIVTTSTNHEGLTDTVKLGKHVWEKESCINCHSLLGEGAYFAPEIGNVWLRYGGADNPEAARAGIKGWIQLQPMGVPGRRQMPSYAHLSEEELDALVDFFRWVSEIDTQGWPPTISG